MGSKSGMIEIKILKVMQLMVMARSRVRLWEWETEMRWRTNLSEVRYFRNREARVARGSTVLMKKSPRTLPGLESGEGSVGHLQTSPPTEGADKKIKRRKPQGGIGDKAVLGGAIILERGRQMA